MWTISWKIDVDHPGHAIHALDFFLKKQSLYLILIIFIELHILKANDIFQDQ